MYTAAAPTRVLPGPTIMPTATGPAEQTPTSAPVGQTTVSSRRVTGDPKALIVQSTDLPPGFQSAGQQAQSSSEYSAVYLRPEALTAQEPTGVSPLGVIVNLSIFVDDAAAVERLKSQGKLDRASIEADIKSTSPNVRQVEVQPVDMQIAGVDDLIAVRARYTIEPTHLLDYRFRIRVGNALANLIVTARIATTDADPSEFQDLAREIARKQVERLNQARR